MWVKVGVRVERLWVRVATRAAWTVIQVRVRVEVRGWVQAIIRVAVTVTVRDLSHRSCEGLEHLEHGEP